MVFEDRVAKYPGRWTMVKPDGASEVITLVRNDEPTKEGTPINAATLNELSTVAGQSTQRKKPLLRRKPPHPKEQRQNRRPPMQQMKLRLT